MSDVKTQTVFVYGTLKRGHRNHRFLKDRGTEFITESTTVGASFIMKRFDSASSPGKYTPGVFLHGESKIRGELYAITQKTLDNLDKLEDLGRKYYRSYVPLDNGKQAWIYIEIEGRRSPLSNSHHIKFKNNTYEWIL